MKSIREAAGIITGKDPVIILDRITLSGYHADSMSVLVFIKDVAIATLGQMASLFLGIFIFGLLIHFISQLTFKSLGYAFGRGGTYVVAWLGTPLHESGHALFCLIFLHRIQEIHFLRKNELTHNFDVHFSPILHI